MEKAAGEPSRSPSHLIPNPTKKDLRSNPFGIKYLEQPPPANPLIPYHFPQDQPLGAGGTLHYDLFLLQLAELTIRPAPTVDPSQHPARFADAIRNSSSSLRSSNSRWIAATAAPKPAAATGREK